MTPAEDPRLDRLRTFYEVLSAPDPVPGDAVSEQETDGWMDRDGADADLAGLISSALDAARFRPGELAECRAASERFGSRLHASSVVEAYPLHRPAVAHVSRATLCCAAWASGRTTIRSMFTWCGRVTAQAMQSAMSSATSGSRTPR